MARKDATIVRNGKIHLDRILLTVPALDESRPAAVRQIRSTHSLRSKLAKRVRDLAHRQRVSEQAIVDCALWHFFDTGQAVNVMPLLGKAGIVPRRRRG